MFNFKDAYYAIKLEDFHYGRSAKDRKFGIYSCYYDGYMLIFNLYLFYFGWWGSKVISDKINVKTIYYDIIK
jgi:hypothetical protein